MAKIEESLEIDLMKKGLRRWKLDWPWMWAIALEIDLMKKGLRRWKLDWPWMWAIALEIDLMKKGLRRVRLAVMRPLDALEIDLMKKGLRHEHLIRYSSDDSSRNRPDEKGIKTSTGTVALCPYNAAVL